MNMYYLSRGEKKIGPLTGEKVRTAIIEGKIRKTDYLKNDKMEKWVEISSTKFLKLFPEDEITPASTKNSGQEKLATREKGLAEGSGVKPPTNTLSLPVKANKAPERVAPPPIPDLPPLPEDPQPITNLSSQPPPETKPSNSTNNNSPEAGKDSPAWYIAIFGLIVGAFWLLIQYGPQRFCYILLNSNDPFLIIRRAGNGEEISEETEASDGTESSDEQGTNNEESDESETDYTSGDNEYCDYGSYEE